MTFGCIGTVTKVDLDKVYIKDFSSGAVFEGSLSKSNLYELKVGMEGYFSGSIINVQGELRLGSVTRCDKTKLLHPLDEEDVYLASGQFTLVDTIDDPFFEFYKANLNVTYYDANVEVIESTETAKVTIDE